MSKGSDLIRVIPNPTSGSIKLDINSPYKSITVLIRDLEGRIINNAVFYSNESVNLDIKGSAGMYFLEVFADDQPPQTFKVIKK